MPDTHSMTQDQIPLSRPLENPVADSAEIFRTVLNAMSRPGRPQSLAYRGDAPDGLFPSTFAVAQTLFDHDTTVFLSPAVDSAAARTDIRFHCGSPVVDRPERAAFAVLSFAEAASLLPALHAGTPDYPDRAATAILQIDGFSDQPGAELTGPGIQDKEGLHIQGGRDFWSCLLANQALYPLGVDILIVSNDAVVGLPRSTRIAPTGIAEEI